MEWEQAAEERAIIANSCNSEDSGQLSPIQITDPILTTVRVYICVWAGMWIIESRSSVIV